MSPLYALHDVSGCAGWYRQLEGKRGRQMADVLIIQAHGQARSMLRHTLEEDGYQVAVAADTIAALAPLYLNPYPLVVIVDSASVRPDSAALDLVTADFGLLGRHRYIVLAEPQLDETLSLAVSPLVILHCDIVRKPVTPAQVKELVTRCALRLPALAPDMVEMDVVAR
jgi:DNA-binding NtrC family response regulator